MAIHHLRGSRSLVPQGERVQKQQRDMWSTMLPIHVMMAETVTESLIYSTRLDVIPAFFPPTRLAGTCT
jgi:hypothetical protein